MGVYFNGKQLITPTTASRVEDSGLANRNLNVANVVAYIGSADGGAPKTPMTFYNPVSARSVLRSGPLLDAIERAFDPSPDTSAPQRVIALRVNPATTSDLTLQDADSSDVIDLVSTDYGLHTRNIRLKIEDGTSFGKRLTSEYNGALYSSDNVGRAVFSVHYTGSEATAVMTITGSQVKLDAPSGTTIATIDLNTATTVAQLVSRMSTVVDFDASVLDGFESHATVDALDYVADVDVKTAAYQARADLQAIVDWFNGTAEGLLDATRVTGAGTVPANLGYTYLDGGEDGTTLASDWSDSLDALQSQDLRWISVLSGDSAVHAMLSAHCAYVSSVGKKERRGFCGGPLDTSREDAEDAAKLIASDRVSYCWPGHYDFTRNGDLELRPSYMTGAIVAAGFAGLPIGQAMSNKAIRCQGLEFDVRNPDDTNPLCEAGVLAVESTETGFRVVQSISTWQTNDNFNRVEVSTGAAYDETSRQLRAVLDKFRGQIGSPELLATVKAAAQSVLDELARPVSRGGPGILVGDEENPPYRGLTISIEADVLRLDVQACAGVPINYNLITIYGVPFKGSVSA